MKVIKPNKLGVLTRCFEHERKFFLGVSVLQFVAIAEREQEMPLLSEVALWSFVAERLGKEAVLDVGVPKCRGEYVVHGRAYAPEGVPHPVVPVRATVGPLQKSLYVFGDRYWQSARHASEARAFAEMPLDWTRAYGGPGYPRNPLGRGHGETELFGQRLQLLPNVERPEQLVASSRQEVEPAGFGPIDLAWPQRQALVGSYDQFWLENLFPGFARDIDWGFFNIAPRDQQREGFWSAGEAYAFDNLHPTRAHLRGCLPPYLARAFIARGARRKRSDEPQTEAELEAALREVALRLQTLWFFPDVEKAVLIFQGSIPIATDDGTDVRYLLLGAEHEQHERRPLSHYAAVLAARLDRKRGMFAALREQDLLPPGQAEVVDEALATGKQIRESEGLTAQNLHRRAMLEYGQIIAQMTAAGVDPALFPEPPKPPEPPPSIDEVPEVLDKLIADAEAKRVEEEARFRAEVVEMEGKIADAGLDAKQLREDMEAPNVGPPTFTAAAQRAALQAVIDECHRHGYGAAAFEEMLADPTTQANWEQGEREALSAYRLAAHHQTPAPRLDEAASAEARASLLAALAKQSPEPNQDPPPVSSLNLTGADLRGIDLRGADLRGALLESAWLDGADLSGADLSQAVLAHASLVEAKLDGCTLDATNLGKANLKKASLAEAQLRATILHAADLTDACLRKAKLVGVEVIKVILTRTDASEIETEKLALIEAPCRGLILRGAKVYRSVFLQLDLEGGDFSGASLRRCAFVGCKLRGVSFAGGDLGNATFVENCELDDAVFTEASMVAANLRGSSMKSCELSKATLDGADLSECDLAGATFYRAIARETRFDKADLSDAVFLSANLLRASLLGATICGADFRASNLYAADMARVRTDERVQLDEANLTKVRVNPTRPDDVEVSDDQRS